MTFHLPRRRIWRLAIYLVALLLVLMAIDLILIEARRTIHPGYESTRILSPRQEDGSIDYLVALDEYFGRGVTPENNAAIPVIQALGRAALPINQPPDGVTDRMGIPHVPENGEYFVPLTKYLEDHGQPKEELHFNDPVSFPIKVSPAVQGWLKAQEKPLRVLIGASQRPRFFIPFNGGTRPETLIELQLPHLGMIRQAMMALRVRALLRIDAGDVAGFREDVLTIARMGSILGGEATLIGRLVAVSLHRSALHAVRTAAAAGKLTPDQMRELREDIAKLAAIGPVVECIDTGERFMVLDLMQTMARQGPRRAARLIVQVDEQVVKFSSLAGGSAMPWRLGEWGLRFVPISYEKTMRQLNSVYDGAIAAFHQPTYPRRREALKLWNEEIDRIATHSQIRGLLSGAWPIQWMMPALARVEAAAETARVEKELTQLALSLSMYQAEHHAYPSTLDDLAPKYLPSVFVDRFSDKPLIYAARPDGYTLYSVGPNGVDDGGKGPPTESSAFSASQPANDDIVASR